MRLIYSCIEMERRNCDLMHENCGTIIPGDRGIMHRGQEMVCENCGTVRGGQDGTRS